MFRRTKALALFHRLAAVLLLAALLVGAGAHAQDKARRSAAQSPTLSLMAPPEAVIIGLPARFTLRLVPSYPQPITFDYRVMSGAEWVEQPTGTVTLPANSSEVQLVLRTVRSQPVPLGAQVSVAVSFGNSRIMAREVVNLVDFAEVITEQQTGGQRFGDSWTARCADDPYQSLCPRAGLPRPGDVAPELGTGQERFRGLPGCEDGRGFNCPPTLPPPLPPPSATSIWLKIAALAAAAALLWTDFLVFVRVQPHVLGISAEGISFAVGDVAAPDVMPQIIAEPGETEFDGPIEAHIIEPGEEGSHGLRV